MPARALIVSLARNLGIVYAEAEVVLYGAQSLLKHRFAEFNGVGYQGGAQLSESQGFLQVYFRAGQMEAHAHPVLNGFYYAALVLNGITLR
jgi:hypothetical protein